MLPKAIPSLTEEQWKQLEAEMQRKPSEKERETIKRAEKRFKDCPL